MWGKRVKTTGLEENFLAEVDFIVEVCKEKIPGNGEDSYLYSLGETAGVVSVFDGCGGSGAKKYEKFQDKSGAYIASRAVAGAVKDWFYRINHTEDKEVQRAELKERIINYLSICKAVGGNTVSFKGSMVKDFPTTMSISVLTKEAGDLTVTCMWAGDSRCYLMNEDGLMQLTEDDLGGIDAMENLTTDGVLTNVISASKDFTIHVSQIQITKPAIIFAATDGCFGYLSTPMEFEYLLESTLSRSVSPTEWEDRLTACVEQIAGDDFTLCGVALKFGSFEKLKNAMQGRSNRLFREYIQKIHEKSLEEKSALWQEYKRDYCRFLR